MNNRSRFEVVHGGATAQPKRRPGGKQWECIRCLRDTGVASSATIVLRIAPVIDRRGGIGGGTLEEACAECWRRGVHTRVGVSRRSR